MPQVPFLWPHHGEGMSQQGEGLFGVSLPNLGLGSFTRVMFLVHVAGEETFEDVSFGGGLDALVQKNGVVRLNVLSLGGLSQIGFALGEAHKKQGPIARPRVLEDISLREKGQ